MRSAAACLSPSDREASRFIWTESSTFSISFSIEKKQIYKLIARHRVARYELVDLIFLRNRETVAQIFVHSVTVNVFNSNVLLLGGPCMELRILSSLTGNIYTFFSKLSRHFVKSVLKHLKNLCFCVKDPQNHLYLATDPPI